MNNAFTFTVPGQPVTWNHMYKEINVPVFDRFGSPIHDSYGRQKMRRGKAKTSEANVFQSGVTLICKAARPSSFKPKHMVIVAYRYYLVKDMDCDNMMKASNDAIARALGLDDKRFLTLPFGKDIVHSNPRMVVTVYDADYYRIKVEAIA